MIVLLDIFASSAKADLFQSLPIKRDRGGNSLTHDLSATAPACLAGTWYAGRDK
jgi:hypothetical protein